MLNPKHLERIADSISLGWKLRPVVFNKNGYRFTNKNNEYGKKLDDKDQVLTHVDDLLLFPDPDKISAVSLVSPLHNNFVCLDFDTKDKELKKLIKAYLKTIFKKEDLFLRIGHPDKLGQFWFSCNDHVQYMTTPNLDIITTQWRCDAIGQYKDTNLTYQWPFKSLFKHSPKELPVISLEQINALKSIISEHTGIDIEGDNAPTGRHGALLKFVNDSIIKEGKHPDDVYQEVKDLDEYQEAFQDRPTSIDNEIIRLISGSVGLRQSSGVVERDRKVENDFKKDTTFDYFDDLAKLPKNDPPFLINELIVEKTVGFLAGMGGVGKSTLCRELAKAISSGTPFLGKNNFQTKKGTVVIINKEDSLIKIISQIHRDNELEKEKLIDKKTAFAEFEDNVDLTEEEEKAIVDKWRNVVRPSWADSTMRLSDDKGIIEENVKKITASLKELQHQLTLKEKPPIKLIIFDPLNMWFSGDLNSAKEVSFAFQAFQEIQREIDTTVMVVNHMNKSGTFSGSTTVRDSGRFMFYLRPAKIGDLDSEKYLEFYIEKHNDAKSGYKAFYVKKLEGGLFDFVSLDEIHEEIRDIEEQKILNALEKKAHKARIELEFKEKYAEAEEQRKAKEAIRKKKLKDLELLEDEDAMRVDVLRAKRRKEIMEEES